MTNERLGILFLAVSIILLLFLTKLLQNGFEKKIDTINKRLDKLEESTSPVEFIRDSFTKEIT